MTTSDPQADRRDDDSREHRTFGQRIRDAVLGEPGDDDRPGGSDTPSDTPTDTPTDTSGTRYADADRDPGRTGVGRPAGYADPDRGDVARGDARYADADRGEVGRETDRGEVGRDTDRGEVGRDTDREYSQYEQAMREHVDKGAVPDPVRDDVRQDGTVRDRADDVADADVAGRGGHGAASDRDLVTSSYDPDRDTGYDPHAAGTAMTGTADTSTEAARSGGSRDFVTSSYDPDRDTGYDPHAAGTAMSGSGTSTAASGGRGADVADVRDRDRRDDDDRRGYDPALDTGYVDEDRADADRRTGRRDADYDTGRVDADEAGSHREAGRGAGAGTAAAVVAGGAAAAAAGVAAARHRESRDSDDARFSEVDDTSTVDATTTGRVTPDRSTGETAADRRADVVADENHADGGHRERLVPADRAKDYSSRWDALKGDFVDEPRRAVAQADDLVGELLDEIQRLFTEQRRDLEQGFDHDRASTEDLRLALRRYRSFFDRLLSF
jgi:hypothetical protein